MSIFTETVNNPAPVGTPKYPNKCIAYGCPLSATSNSTDLGRWLCDLHFRVDPSKWQEVTTRIRANKWLFDLQTYIRTVPKWQLIPLEEEHIQHINSVAKAHNCEFLMLTGGKEIVNGRTINANDYEGFYLWPAMLAIIQKEKEPEELGKKLPPAEDSFPEEEDFPF